MKKELLKVLSHEMLTRSETRNILIGIANREYPDTQVAALLATLALRGTTVDELLGFRDGMMETGNRVTLNNLRFIDIVGTGGDCKNTFNISTASCFVVAGAGYKVAKHGNYSATSVSGASNVMENHGITFTADNELLQRSIDQSGVAYLHARLFANAMKSVAGVRSQLAFPTVFNLLGPICNPATPPCQMLGVATLDQMRLYSQVYRKLQVDYVIVNSIDGYDEISLTGEFKVATGKYERIFKPEDIGFKRVKASDIQGGDTPMQAKELFDAVLENTAPRACLDVVVANAAFAIQALEHFQKPIGECVDIARASLMEGKALKALQTFVTINTPHQACSGQ